MTIDTKNIVASGKFNAFFLIAVSLLIYYTIIWYPIHYQTQLLEDKIRQKQTVLLWLQRANLEISALHQQNIPPIANNSTALAAILEQDAKANNWNVFITGTHEVSKHQVEIRFARIPFTTLIQIIESLWLQYHVEVSNIHILKLQTENIVQVAAFFQLS